MQHHQPGCSLFLTRSVTIIRNSACQIRQTAGSQWPARQSSITWSPPRCSGHGVGAERRVLAAACVFILPRPSIIITAVVRCEPAHGFRPPVQLMEHGRCGTLMEQPKFSLPSRSSHCPYCYPPSFHQLQWQILCEPGLLCSMDQDLARHVGC
jgi:hypothetical protein